MSKSSTYIEIVPDLESGFIIPASGVLANAVIPHEPLDRLIAVSGYFDGWHIFGDNSSSIKEKIESASLLYLWEIH